MEVSNANEGTAGGFKEIVCSVTGDNVYGILKYESGVHRVQRVPATETQGTQILTPFACGAFTKLFSKDRVNKYFEKGIVSFFAGGTGHPYFSTDTATVLRAIEIEADVILLAKSIDGVYDSDPKTNPDAKKYDDISIQEVIDRKLGVSVQENAC